MVPEVLTARMTPSCVKATALHALPCVADVGEPRKVKQSYLKHTDMDWEKFRAETAAAIISSEAGAMGTSMELQYAEARCQIAIAWADELIKQLKEAH